MVFNLCALALVVSLIGLGESTMSSAASSILQVAGIRTSTASGIAVDSNGQIRYRSRTVALEDLVIVLKKDLQAGGASVAVQVDAKADAARVAQILRAAGAAGAQTVRLSTTREKP
jgi:biopolymer transport protein ExbD